MKVHEIKIVGKHGGNHYAWWNSWQQGLIESLTNKNGVVGVGFDHFFDKQRTIEVEVVTVTPIKANNSCAWQWRGLFWPLVECVERRETKWRQG